MGGRLAAVSLSCSHDVFSSICASLSNWSYVLIQARMPYAETHTAKLWLSLSIPGNQRQKCVMCCSEFLSVINSVSNVATEVKQDDLQSVRQIVKIALFCTFRIPETYSSCLVIFICLSQWWQIKRKKITQQNLPGILVNFSVSRDLSWRRCFPFHS